MNGYSCDVRFNSIFAMLNLISYSYPFINHYLLHINDHNLEHCNSSTFSYPQKGESHSCKSAFSKRDRQSMYNVIHYCPPSTTRIYFSKKNSCNCGKHVLYIILEAVTRKRKPGTRDIDFARLFITRGTLDACARKYTYQDYMLREINVVALHSICILIRQKESKFMPGTVGKNSSSMPVRCSDC